MAKNCVVIRDLPSQNAVDYRFGVMEEPIQNGHVVALNNLKERDLWIAEPGDDAVDNLWLVTGVELMYEENPRKHLWDFVNKAGEAFRCERLMAGGIYSISTEGLSISDEETNLVAGASVCYAPGETKLSVTKLTAGWFVGKVIDVYTKAGMKFAAIQFFKTAEYVNI